MASEMLITGMKLGRRWLYVLWIAATVLWHQAGASSPAFHLTTTPQWDLAKKETPPPPAGFTLPGTDNLEDQSLTKRPSASTSFLEDFTGLNARELIVIGSARGDLPECISSIKTTWHSTRGPPAGV
jgi:hypothetical protein